MITNLKNYGLIPAALPRNHPTTHQVFGSVALANLPAAFTLPDIVGPVDQGDTSICYAYCTRQLLSDQHSLVYDENWNVAKSGEALGQATVNGCSALVAMQAMVKFGALPASVAPAGMTWQEKGVPYIANWNNWPTPLDEQAAPSEEGSVLSVDGPYDDFDNVRSAIQMHGRHVALATKWYQEFNQPNPDGTVNDPGSMFPVTDFTWHMYEAMDWLTLTTQPLLRIKPHEGAGYGAGGYSYLNRSQVNSLVEDPQAVALMFSDAPASIVARMQIQNLSLEEIFAELAARIESSI